MKIVTSWQLTAKQAENVVQISKANKGKINPYSKRDGRWKWWELGQKLTNNQGRID